MVKNLLANAGGEIDTGSIPGLRISPGVDDGQGSLAYYSPWGHKDLDTIEQLN